MIYESLNSALGRRNEISFYLISIHVTNVFHFLLSFACSMTMIQVDFHEDGLSHLTFSPSSNDKSFSNFSITSKIFLLLSFRSQ